jgi:N-acetylneuraminic acid mutarotase
MLLVAACIADPITTPATSSTPTSSLTSESSSPPEDWGRRAALGIARSEMPAVVVDDSIYVMGGLVSGPQGYAATDAVERYRPDQDRWEPVPALPSPRHHTMAAAADGLIYVLGGYGADGFNAVASSWVYDQTSWSEIADLPEAVGAGAAAALDGAIYLVGGVPDGTSALGYDPVTNTWTSLAPMSQPREHFALVYHEGELWALGGRWNGVMLDSVEIFDPAAGTWRDGPSMIAARSGFGAAVAGDVLTVAGGEVFDPTRTLTEVERLIDGVWVLGPELPLPLHGVPMATVGDDLYVIGGSQEAGDVVNSADTWLLGG